MRGLLMALLVSSCFVVTSFAEAGQTRVRGYTTRRGTYVGSYMRTTPNRTRLDNWSTRGNVNPYTGKRGYRNPW